MPSTINRAIYVDGYFAAQQDVSSKKEETENPYHNTSDYKSFYDWLQGYEAYLTEYNLNQ